VTPALGVGELVGGDPEQPGLRRPAVGAIPAARDQRRGEHLGGDVGRELGLIRPQGAEAQHPIEMAAIEGAEVLEDLPVPAHASEYSLSGGRL
jgi:hypothetical protein